MAEVAVGILGGDSAPVRPTANCVVTARVDGIQVQAGLLTPPTYVGRPELEVLAALDRSGSTPHKEVVKQVARDTKSDFWALAKFVSKARMAGWVAPDVTPRDYAVVDHPDLNAPGMSDAAFEIEGDGLITLRLPLVFRLQGGRYDLIDYDGLRVASLLPSDVSALDALLQPTSARSFVADIVRRALPGLGDAEAVAGFLGMLDRIGLVKPVKLTPTSEAHAIDRSAVVSEVFDRHAAAQTAAEAERAARTGEVRTNVIPVAFDMGTPAGLGMVIAAAKAHENGLLESTYCFRTDWVWSDDRLEEFTREPAVYLFSNYLWSHERCIEISKRVKELSPQSVTIHGGPDTPKYEADAAAYFATHPHVDVAVRGEGEMTATAVLAALMPGFRDGSVSLSALVDVAGITYRDGDQIVRNPDRDRIADMNTLPSPFLTGLFDPFIEVPDMFVTLETNRGCPYGCTFCDWGSATTSRVRQFDMERVFAELQWCAESRVSSVSVADANFGMFKRDVEIAEKVADLKRSTGHPPAFGVSFAKNTVKHLEQIIGILAEAGIMAQGVLSLQTMDPGTLEVIRRSNIKTERYDRLAGEMRRSKLPLMIELMMGLPGQTVASFADDLQQCINREVPARVNHTTVLINSPMNDPAYRAEHQIVTGAPVGPGTHANVISSSSFTQDDYREMELLRRSMLIFEDFGMLRILSRFVHQETGRREIDFYDALRTGTDARPEEWPALRTLVRVGYAMMTAPYSWALVMDDLKRFLVSEWGMADDSALDSVLRTQRALLPAHGRTFPEVVTLPHDVVAWHNAMLAAKNEGHLTDWMDVTPRLATFGPGDLIVDDPDHVVETSLGLNSEMGVLGFNWELDSPLSRARIAATQLVDWVSDRVMPRATERVPEKTAERAS